MRILFVNEYAYPNVVSGAEFSMHALAQELAKKHNVIILSPQLSKKKYDHYNGVKLLYFWFPVKIKPYKVLSPIWFNNPLFWFYSAIIIFWIIIKEKVDIIHVQGKYLLPSAIIARIFTGKPVLVTVRDYKFLCPLAICLIDQNKACNWSYFLTREITNYLERYEPGRNCFARLILSIRIILGKIMQNLLWQFLKAADAVIGVSFAIAEIYHKNGITKDKLFSIYNLPPKNQEIPLLEKKDNTILYVGRLSYGKGTDLLINAQKIVKKKLPTAKLVLIGRKSPSLNHLPVNLIWHKYIPHEKILSFYKKACIFVLPSRWPEPLSRASLEALSTGLPLVLSDRGGNKEVVINGLNGYLVPPESQKLAEKILLILQNKRTAIKMGKESQKLLQRLFNPNIIINQHIKLYERLTK